MERKDIVRWEGNCLMGGGNNVGEGSNWLLREVNDIKREGDFGY